MPCPKQGAAGFEGQTKEGDVHKTSAAAVVAVAADINATLMSMKCNYTEVQ